MRLKRFFVTEDLGELVSKVSLSPVLTNQIKNVFRLKVGETVILFNGSGYNYYYEIVNYNGDQVVVSYKEKIKNEIESGREIYLFASMIKKDNFEWIVEKATELGVSHIVPILSARSEKKGLNIERLQKIIIEASEQSGRDDLPMLHDIMNLEEALEKFKDIPTIVWHPNAPKFVSQDLEGKKGMFIGPEGGWTKEEIDLFTNHSVPVLSLGPQTLRAETAVIAALARMVF